MALIRVPEHTRDDLRAWARLERYDRLLARSPRLKRLESRAIQAIRDFARETCYCGVTWGKDSMVVAHLVARSGIRIPLLWSRVTPRDNPHCEMTRDIAKTYLAKMLYCEIITLAWRGGCDYMGHAGAPTAWHCDQRPAWKLAGELFGDRYISGIRAEESGGRKWRARRWGVSSPRTCAPIIHWTAADVFAYLARYDLPVHPIYAMTLGGVLDRGRLRVDVMAGECTGDMFGRISHERRYYRRFMRQLDEMDWTNARNGAAQWRLVWGGVQ